MTATATAAQAQPVRAGDITIEHAYAAPSLAGTGNGAAYIGKLENRGQQPDRLLRVATPVAGSAELHSMHVDAQGVMRMREAGAIVVAPGAAVAMRPGEGLHVMLTGLKQPLKEGDRFPMTMEFERGGKVEVQVRVEGRGAAAGSAAGHRH